jgi:DNA-binding transcriptional LysR family regulator
LYIGIEMDVHRVRTFIAAADTGSFIAAATRVHASASAVTERIKQLELLLGARLFERDKRGCRLTQAGHRFMEPAQAMIRAWETGRSRVNLPARYHHSLRIGGQHALWPALLIPMLNELTHARPDIAVRAAAAAPAQINRALADGELDMAFLYDPVLRSGIRIEQLVADRLVLVSSRPDLEWREIFVHFDWGESANAEIRARMGDLPPAGIQLDLGILSLDWLTSTGGAGFVPERMATGQLHEGKLAIIEGVPSVEFSPFICWRASLDTTICETLIALARRHDTHPSAAWLAADPVHCG